MAVTHRVKVINGYKSYGAHCVLKGINLTANKSSIYGLLGASGCGKTSLLCCILGLKRLDSGKIYLEGINYRKEIGYMPQETSVFEHFTIKEICLFYGRMYGLKEDRVLNRILELIDMFDLTSPDRSIASLSGGEKRRVSLAVTVIHDPILLILDEPTVGMDCILGERIWNYLLNLKSQGTSIILSTHYFQEASLCSEVGFMRNGVILAEDSPTNLLSLYNSNSLETVLLELSRIQEKNGNSNDNEEDTDNQGSTIWKKRINFNSDLFPKEKLFNCHRFYAQLSKNISWHTEHYWITLAILSYPLWIAIIYSLITGSLNTKDYTVGLLNERFPKQFIYQEYCYNSSYILLDYGINCTIPNEITCLLIQNIQLNFNIEYYNNWNTAKLNFERNKINAILQIPDNFTESIMRRVEYGFKTDTETVNRGIISVTIDTSSFLTYNILTKHLRRMWIDVFKNLMRLCGLSENNTPQPFKMEEPIFGSMNTSFSESSLPGFLSGFSAFYPLIYTVSVLMNDKLEGLITRNHAAGMTYMEIVSAHVVAQFVIMLIQDITVLIAFFLLFQYKLVGNIFSVLLIQLLANIFGFSLGFMTSELFSNHAIAVYFCIGVTVVIFHLSGIIWPLEGFHASLYPLQWLCPSVTMSQSFDSTISHNFSISNVRLFKGIVVNIYLIILIALLTTLLFYFKKYNY